MHFPHDKHYIKVITVSQFYEFQFYPERTILYMKKINILSWGWLRPWFQHPIPHKNIYTYEAFLPPGSILNTAYLSYLIHQQCFELVCSYYPHLTDEEIKGKRSTKML